MTRCVNHLMLLGLVCLTYAATETMASPGPPAAGHPNRITGSAFDTWDRTHGFLEWAFGELDESEIAANARDYAYVFSASIPVVPFFRSANPDMQVGHYIPGFWDHYDTRPNFGGPDTPETRARTLQWWQSEVDETGHPDLIVYKCDGITPAYFYYP